jgi:hypothetical protein
MKRGEDIVSGNFYPFKKKWELLESGREGGGVRGKGFCRKRWQQGGRRLELFCVLKLPWCQIS